jgi:hypothetical protein
MRSAMMLAAVTAAFATLPATAWAEDWCGYGNAAKSLVQCGYSSNTECETAVGKAGMCFVNPEFALNAKHATPLIAAGLAPPRS